MPTLIITNGDSAADLLAEAGRDGVILPWRDVLHEGPITAGSLEALTVNRAAFLAQRLRLDPAEVLTGFVERDTLIRGHAGFDRIELWFEHDLYDQLQLIQILSFFGNENRREGLTLIQANDFLGHQRPETVLRFADHGRPLEASDLALGVDVWSDLASDSPRPIAKRIDQPTTGFAFLGPALRRFLEELPGRDGLSRTEATALAAVANGICEPLKLFPDVLAREEAAFVGDFSFFAIIDDLLAAPTPLIAGADRLTDAADRVERLRSCRLSLTDAGRAVLGGTADHVTLNGIDRFWAGTRLKGHDVWRYDRKTGHLVAPQASAA